MGMAAMTTHPDILPGAHEICQLEHYLVVSGQMLPVDPRNMEMARRPVREVETIPLWRKRRGSV